MQSRPTAVLPRGVDSLDDLAARPGVREACRLFSRERRWLDEMHLTVCRVPAPTFFEQRRAEWMAHELERWGWETRMDRAGNVIATLPSTPKDAPLVALTAHLDTVLAPKAPEDIRVDSNDRLRGPGVSDNGAGLVGLLGVARAVTECGFPEFGQARLLLAATVGEEGEGNLSGMKYLCRQSTLAERLRSLVVLDGPDVHHITAEALSCRRYEITVTGPGGHSWSDHGTANAIHAMARAITWYADQCSDPGRAREGRTSFNFGVIEGGATVNSIPAQAKVKVDLRAECPGDLDGLSTLLASTLERALLEENERALAGRVTGKLKETGWRPGGRLREGSPILGYIQALDSHMGIRSHLDCASTDANVPLWMGLPAISIGAGGQGGGAHTPAEWYCTDGRDIGLRRVLMLIALLLAEAGGNAE
jgi:acetylornithine deacetylase/succinyl-diaminopimelate desuccinylase-like protein